MENNTLREEQIEALEVAYGYSKKLINAIGNVIQELRVKRLEDTQEYLDSIISGLNWTIEVINGTKDVLNEKEEVIKKEEVNQVVMNLSESLVNKDDKATANIMEKDIVPFLYLFQKAAKEVAGIEEN